MQQFNEKAPSNATALPLPTRQADQVQVLRAAVTLRRAPIPRKHKEFRKYAGRLRSTIASAAVAARARAGITNVGDMHIFLFMKRGVVCRSGCLRSFGRGKHCAFVASAATAMCNL
eukprot:scaffold95944_cov33-Tisochrysis_lutea.AAC.4